MLEKIKENTMFLKGIIHFTGNNKEFEVLNEEFFNNYLEKNGNFLSQSDFCVSLENELECFDWDINPKKGEVYGVLFQFKLNYSKHWTHYGYEYDSEVELINLEFNLFDDKSTKELFSSDMFQFD